mgnify:CR=1 FL=1
MTKVKLINGAIINALEVKMENGFLKITTEENTVEELAELFANKENTNLITLMTETEIESGFKVGFTSFVGIEYDANGVKTVSLMQPADVTEARLSNAEGLANQSLATAKALEERVVVVEEGQEIQDGAIVELAEIIGGE